MTHRLSALLLIALVLGASCASAPHGEEPPAEPPPAAAPVEAASGGESAVPDTAGVNPPAPDQPESAAIGPAVGPAVGLADGGAVEVKPGEAAEAASTGDTASAIAEGAEAASAGGGDGPPEAAGETPAGAIPAEETPPEEDPAKKLLELEIKTSTLTELAVWCRTLGLSEGGTKEELANRLRDHLELPRPGAETPEPGKKQKTITIESARSTEYFTLETVDEEYARLRGDVLVSLKDGDAVHRIRAWEILYNRTRNTMSASGGVEYVKEEGVTRETFKGESISVDLDNWSTIFVNGVSERSVSSDAATYRFAGTIITRDDEEVTILTRAEISNAAQEKPYWSILASKVWLLPGSDFAILNAVLKVGEIPLLYIPAFFFPANEIIFHPVIGTRTREGSFVQTTTYILGRPKSSGQTESSISKILGNSTDNEKVREGIFLRNTGKKSTDPNTTRLSVLLDAYTNLGVYLGAEMELPAKGIWGALNLSAGIGFTRDIYQKGGGLFTPFNEYDGESDWNVSRLFGEEVPFRYRLETKSSLSGKYGSLSWSFPFYSDPYVKRDFLNRSEEMDWFNMAKQGAAGAQAEDTASATANVLGSYEWTLNGSLRPTVTKLSPYISSFSISSISSTIAFRTRNSTSKAGGVSPERTFFFPDKFTLISISAPVSGTLLTLGSASANTSANAANAAAAPGNNQVKEEPEDPFKGMGPPRSPWESAVPADDQDSGEWYRLKPPAISQVFTVSKPRGPGFSINYRFGPSAASELQLRSSQANWPEVEDVDWGEVSSILSTLRSDGNLTFALSDSSGLYTLSFGLNGNAAWQDYSMMNDEAEEFDTQAKKDAAMLRVHNATNFTTSSDLSTTIKPLYWDPVWGNSSLRYSLRNLLAKSAFNSSTGGTGMPDPEWDIKYGSWEKENIDAHQMALNVAASVMDKNQTLSLTADLPPRDSALSLDAALRVWISETSIRERFFKPFEEDQKIEPLYFTETLRFADKFSAQQYFVYDPAKEDFTSLTSTLTLNVFTLAYTMVRSRAYEFDARQGWVLSTGDESFNPQNIRLSYSQNFSRNNGSLLWWKDRFNMTFGITSDLTFDLQRYTYSNFNLSLNFSLDVTKFLKITLGYSARNAEIFRYFQDIPAFDLGVELPGEKDLFKDILNSLRFDDEILRRSSGFKLRSFNLNITHHLGDWDAVFGLTLVPELDQTTLPYKYKFRNDFSFLVKWIPISEFKTEIQYSKETFTVK
ncbi:MAG: LPS-assembly protein LptD [Treponema sp.]|jgi:hypothetical protein|nr:LPS-assembly protein LptD [Treponema sp.]